MSDGLQNGFQLIPAGAILRPEEINNYKAATGPEVRDKVEQTLLKEVACRNYVVTDMKPTIVSALGAVLKPESDEVHLIHDCSQPSGDAVNDYADIESFKYESLEDALKLLKPGYYMAKVDLRHAYRSVAIHPKNIHATSLKWKFSGDKQHTYLIDTKLPYEGQRTPGIFHRLTQAVRCMMARRGYGCIIVYLDDFLVIGSTLSECQEVFDCLIQLLQDLGFDISWRKVVPPTQVLIFAGVLIDTVGRFLALPDGNLVELQIFMHHPHWHRDSKRELQVLAGKLNWGGRTFLRHILDAISGLWLLSDRFRLTCEFYADLSWWADFLSVVNGKWMFLDNIPVVDVETDACFEAAEGFFQGGLVLLSFWCRVCLLAGLHINHKEVLAVMAAAERWGIVGLTNMSSFIVTVPLLLLLSTKVPHVPPIVMPYLRRLFWASAIYNFRITARHIPGKENFIADPISHLHSPCY